MVHFGISANKERLGAEGKHVFGVLTRPVTFLLFLQTSFILRAFSVSSGVNPVTPTPCSPRPVESPNLPSK